MGRDIAFNLGRGIDNTQFTSRGMPPTASATFTHATTNNATNHFNVTRNASISSAVFWRLLWRSASPQQLARIPAAVAKSSRTE